MDFKEDRVRIAVEHDGPGIEPDREQAILQVFARSDAIQGHPGLGLSIVQRVAQRLGGGVAFQRSTDGTRNVVRVDWPMG